MRNEESADRWLFIFDRKYLGDGGAVCCGKKSDVRMDNSTGEIYDYGGGNGAVGSVWHGDPFRCSGDCDHDG